MKHTRIRALTIGINPDQYNLTTLINKLDHFYALAIPAFQQTAFPIQTRRLTLPPVILDNLTTFYQIKSTIDTLSRTLEQFDIRWFCLPLQSQMQLTTENEKLITTLIRNYPKLFIHFIVANQGNIYNNFLISAARSVLNISRLSNNGYDNFRVGIGANIKPNTPYFPFSYHHGNMGFSLAVELIEQCIQTVKESSLLSLDGVRERLISVISPIISEIDHIGKKLEDDTGIEFKGQDISISPFPGPNRSVATLIEMLGPSHCGETGTLMITSLLTDVLKTAINRTNIRTTGFNGVMFSLLEDQRLAETNNHRYLSIEKLMLYAAVCGCGLDMVPVSGDIFEEELTSLILDIAALSCVLKKPLGIRVLPIPMKITNELTNFNHDFLTNTRINSVNGHGFAFPLSLTNYFNYLRFEEKEIFREIG